MRSVMERGLICNAHYSMGRKENQMGKLENLLHMMDALATMCEIDNDTDDPVIDGYNRGIYAMQHQVIYYIKNILMKEEGEENG